jgi:hypothetical protein
MEELIKIQPAMKIGKSNSNKYGGFKYRTIDDINEVAKPILEKLECYVISRNEPVVIEGWHYIKVTTSLYNKNGQVVETCSYAREMSSKKKMDEPQVTGCSITYALKQTFVQLYNLGGSDDPDSMDNSSSGQPAPKVISPPKIELTPEEKDKKASTFVDNLIAKVQQEAKTEEDLITIEKNNYNHLQRIKDGYPDLYTKYKDESKKVLTKIQENNNEL